jgi:hypothetical protein
MAFEITWFQFGKQLHKKYKQNWPHNRRFHGHTMVEQTQKPSPEKQNPVLGTMHKHKQFASLNMGRNHNSTQQTTQKATALVQGTKCQGTIYMAAKPANRSLSQQHQHLFPYHRS